MKDINLHEALQQQLMENEFENQKPSGQATQDSLYAERVRLKKKMDSFGFQATQLIEKLYRLKKNLL